MHAIPLPFHLSPRPVQLTVSRCISLLTHFLSACLPHRQVVGQLEILAQTVALLEQRLSLSEDRNARLEGLLKRALSGQGQTA